MSSTAALALGAIQPEAPKCARGSLLDVKLLHVGACMFAWVLGTWAAIRLLVEFESALKPLALAALSVSILEWVVQTLEFLQWKGWVFLFLCFQKVKLLTVVLCLGIRYCVLRCFSKPDWTQCRKRQGEIMDRLSDWQRLRLGWDPIFAGRNLLFRCTAVLITLSILATCVLGLSSLLYKNIEDFASGERVDQYRNQLFEHISTGNSALKQLPDHIGFLPKGIQDLLHDAIEEFQSAFQASSAFTRENQEYLVKALKEAVGCSSAFLSHVAFYVLYTTIWLVVPLQINPDQVKEKHALDIYCVQGSRRSQLTVPDSVRVEEGPRSGDPRRSKYALMWQFYEVKSDPRQGLQERMYHIMQVYFSLKLLVNGLFASCLWCLLYFLGADLSGVLAVSCFCLSFIPELGTIISMILPVPVLLLMPLPSSDASRLAVLGRFLIGMTVIKVLVSNVLESYLMGHNPTLSGAVRDNKLEEIKETHPVLILFFVVFAGHIWGPVGMLLSVPLISLARLMLNFWYLHEPEPQGTVTLEDPMV